MRVVYLAEVQPRFLCITSDFLSKIVLFRFAKENLTHQVK